VSELARRLSWTCDSYNCKTHALLMFHRHEKSDDWHFFSLMVAKNRVRKERVKEINENFEKT
jgi:3'-phosphoadenosine 5'-phosphosulfate sulfotransferase